MNDESDSDVFKVLAPYLAGAVLLAVGIVVLLLRFTPLANVGVTGGTVNAVTFDIVKYSNAQRAVASTFIKKEADVSEANDLLLNLSERGRKAIAEVAGPRTLVLVKQSVAQGVERDITDAVLTKLGLPTNVPTSDATAYTLDMAPTMLALPQYRESKPLLPTGKNVLP